MACKPRCACNADSLNLQDTRSPSFPLPSVGIMQRIRESLNFPRFRWAGANTHCAGPERKATGSLPAPWKCAAQQMLCISKRISGKQSSDTGLPSRLTCRWFTPCTTGSMSALPRPCHCRVSCSVDSGSCRRPTCTRGDRFPPMPGPTRVNSRIGPSASRHPQATSPDCCVKKAFFIC